MTKLSKNNFQDKYLQSAKQNKADRRTNYPLSAPPPDKSTTKSRIGLLRCFTGPVALLADVDKAFLQLELFPAVTRFLWLKKPNKGFFTENVEHYRFTRVSFEIIISSFLLNATIRHPLQTVRTTTAQQILQGSYVDSLVMGAENSDEAIKIHNEAKRLPRILVWHTSKNSFPLSKIPASQNLEQTESCSAQHNGEESCPSRPYISLPSLHF
ncbi:unnamed protein product [Toxocara canis]|uniref:Reverse transcriptase domain-containing protein n=1 Tax=Toxocara canis TaxID=6265 RepID=A0A183V9U2_TOXCA|nr:unnamed protein product [Toxocara canis]